MAKQVKITREVTFEELEEKYQKESDGNKKLRFLMLMHSKNGLSANQTSKLLFVDKNTVILWIRKFNEFGFPGLDDDPRSGRPKKVDYDQFKQAMDASPKKYGYPHEVWYPKLVLQYLKEHQEVEIAENYVYKLIKRAGYSLKVPSRKSYKSDENKVILFKKNEKNPDETA